MSQRTPGRPIPHAVALCEAASSVRCSVVHVVFLALSPATQAPTVEEMEYVLAHRGHVTLVAGDPRTWGQLDQRIDAVGLSPAEQQHWLLRGERFLFCGIPDLPLRLMRRLLEPCAQRAPETVERRLIRTVEAVDRGRGRVRSAAKRLHDGWFMPHYRMVRPWVLWRVARRGLLREHDFRDADQIVVADVFSTALGWHLARRLPNVKVGFSLDRKLVGGQAA